MTALIRQKWSDEMIPARVGDVVCFNPKILHTITSIQNSVYCITFEDGETSLPELLTLISRPFQDNDPILLVAPSGKLFQPDIYCSHPDAQAILGDYCSEHNLRIIHANPLWRTKE